MKCLVAGVGEAAGDEQPGDVASAEAWRGLLDQLHAIRGQSCSLIGEPRNEVVEPFAAAGAETGQGSIQFRMIGAEEVTEEMDLATLECGADLDARDHFEVIAGRRDGFGQRGEGVVIGDGNRGEFRLPGQCDHLRRRVFAVAGSCVNV